MTPERACCGCHMSTRRSFLVPSPGAMRVWTRVYTCESERERRDAVKPHPSFLLMVLRVEWRVGVPHSLQVSDCAVLLSLMAQWEGEAMTVPWGLPEKDPSGRCCCSQPLCKEDAAPRQGYVWQGPRGTLSLLHVDLVASRREPRGIP